MDPQLHTLRQLRAHARQLEDINAREIGPVVLRYTTNAGQTLLDSTLTILNFEDITFDTRAAVTIGAAWVFTCPVAGYYWVRARADIDHTPSAWAAGELLSLDIYVNAAYVSRLYSNDNLAGAQVTERHAEGSDLVHLDKGDALDVRIFQGSGTTRSINTNTEENYISIARM